MEKKENPSRSECPKCRYVEKNLTNLWHYYTPDELHKALLNTLYYAISNENSGIKQAEFTEMVHAITQVCDTLRKLEASKKD